MGSVEEIENAVAALAPKDFARFRSWFDEITAERFDAAIAADAKEGRLDDLAEQALRDVREGRARPL